MKAKENIPINAAALLIISLLMIAGCEAVKKNITDEPKKNPILTDEGLLNDNIQDVRENGTLKNTGCNITKHEMVIQGSSMEPLLKAGDSLMLLEGYYSCNEPKKGDMVAYKLSSAENPMIKIIRATSEDDVRLEDGMLLINREAMKNSADDIYIFNQKQQNMLSLYIKNNSIPAGSYLLFGDNLHSSRDSREIGAVGKNAMIGKFLAE